MTTPAQYEIRISMENKEGRRVAPWIHTTTGTDIDSVLKGARGVADIFAENGFDILDVHVSLVNVYDIVY
jgi:hypothetical protein